MATKKSNSTLEQTPTQLKSEILSSIVDRNNTNIITLTNVAKRLAYLYSRLMYVAEEDESTVNKYASEDKIVESCESCPIVIQLESQANKIYSITNDIIYMLNMLERL